MSSTISASINCYAYFLNFFYGFPSAINRDETPGQRNFDLFDVRPMGPNF